MQNIQLVATNPQEMAAAQAHLLKHCETLAQEKSDMARELKQNLELAVKNKWRTTTLKKAYDVAIKTAIYYQKIKSAVRAGYYIVPNMPIDVFAIRTSRQNPKYKSARTYADFSQKAQLLPEGEGRYVSPDPLGQNYTQKDERGNALSYFATNSFDGVTFPVALVRPQIMEATSEAMALHIFDQIGIAPQTKKGDPMIIGQILKPGTVDFGVHGRKKAVSFLLAWFLDTDVL